MRRKAKSPWEKVIFGCSEREAHLRQGFDAARNSVEIGDFGFGTEVVLACLAHTFGLNDEELDELREQILEEEEDETVSLELPPYRGGDIRLPEDPDRDERWVSTLDLHGVIEARALELDSPDDYGSAVFWFEIWNGHESWTSSLDFRRLGDVGWLTSDYVNENENFVTGVLGCWAPFDDAEARRRAIVSAYYWEGCNFPPLHSAACHGELDVLVDCLAAVCAPRRERYSDLGWRQISRAVLGNAEMRRTVEEGSWQRLGVPMPAEDWWLDLSEETAEQRRGDPQFCRMFAAYYVLLHTPEETD